MQARCDAQKVIILNFNFAFVEFTSGQHDLMWSKSETEFNIFNSLSVKIFSLAFSDLSDKLHIHKRIITFLIQ